MAEKVKLARLGRSTDAFGKWPCVGERVYTCKHIVLAVPNTVRGLSHGATPVHASKLPGADLSAVLHQMAANAVRVTAYRKGRCANVLDSGGV